MLQPVGPTCRNPESSVKRLARRYPIRAFLMLAVAISWLLVAVRTASIVNGLSEQTTLVSMILVAQFGPSIAAVFMTRWLSGRMRLADFLRAGTRELWPSGNQDCGRHRVPLSTECLAVVQRVKDLDDQFVFGPAMSGDVTGAANVGNANCSRRILHPCWTAALAVLGRKRASRLGSAHRR